MTSLVVSKEYESINQSNNNSKFEFKSAVIAQKWFGYFVTKKNSSEPMKEVEKKILEEMENRVEKNLRFTDRGWKYKNADVNKTVVNLVEKDIKKLADLFNEESCDINKWTLESQVAAHLILKTIKEAFKILVFHGKPLMDSIYEMEVGNKEKDPYKHLITNHENFKLSLTKFDPDTLQHFRHELCDNLTDVRNKEFNVLRQFERLHCIGVLNKNWLSRNIDELTEREIARKGLHISTS